MSDDIKLIGIVGAGQMGLGIAQVLATSGFNVLINDRDQITLNNASNIIKDNIIKAINASKKTTMSRFLNALGIRNVGEHLSKTLETYFNGNIEELIRSDYQNLIQINELQEFENLGYQTFNSTRNIFTELWVDTVNGDIYTNMRNVPEDQILLKYPGNSEFSNHEDLRMDLLKIKTRVAPVGRLDKNTTGLLLLTNDGELHQYLTHPSNGVIKSYEAIIEGRLDYRNVDKIKKGIYIGYNAVSYTHLTLPTKRIV